MPFIEFLANAFINTFGITQPTEKTRRHAAWFIIVLLTVALCVAAGIGLLFLHVLRN